MLITLQKFELEHIPKKVEWINNPENNKYLHYELPLEYKKTEDWFSNKDNRSRIDYVVVVDGNPVGIIGLLDIDEIKKTAEYYITIGELEYRHKGIATEATLILLEYAKCDLKLKRVYLNVDCDNEYARQLYEKCGFSIESQFEQTDILKNKIIKRYRYTYNLEDK